MSRTRAGDTTWRLLSDASSSAASVRTHRFVCRSCLARRHFHTSRPSLASLGPIQGRPDATKPTSSAGLQRMRDDVHGHRKDEEAAQRRDAARAKRMEEREHEKVPDDLMTVVAAGRDLKPLEYTIADVADARHHQGYKPATTWRGLKRVGGDALVQARQFKEAERYRGFFPSTRQPSSPTQWQTILYATAVHVLALLGAKEDLQLLHQRFMDLETWERLLSTKLVATKEDGRVKVALERPEAELANSLRCLPEIKVANPVIARKALTIGLETPIDAKPTWLNMELTDPAIKLAFVKRIVQLTGRRLSDPVIANVKTVRDLHEALKSKVPARKLAESEQLKATHASLPNVTVHGKRPTLIERESEVGRWKLIVDELAKRDLPIRGSTYRRAKVDLSDPTKQRKRKPKSRLYTDSLPFPTARPGEPVKDEASFA